MIHSKTRTLAGVMLRSGSTYREVSDALEISVGSVHNISREDMDYLMPLVMEMKRRSAYRCYLLAEHTLSRMSDADFERASLKQKSIAAGILYDKGAMLEGIMPGPDEQPWDESKPGEMGRLYWPERRKDALPKDELQVLLMSLFMQGRDADAWRIGRTAGVSKKYIRECRDDWESMFDEPTTREEAWQWKDEGRLRRDYDASHLPWDEDEKDAWERERRRKRSYELSGMKDPFAKAADDVTETSADGTVADAGASDNVITEGSHAQTSWPQADGNSSVPELKLGMEKALDDNLKARMELNRIEQAVNAQLDEKYGKIPGTEEEN